MFKGTRKKNFYSYLYSPLKGGGAGVCAKKCILFFLFFFKRDVFKWKTLQKLSFKGSFRCTLFKGTFFIFFLMQLSLLEFAGFKNKYMFMYKNKKNFHKIPCSANSWEGVKALADCPFKNTSFFYVLPTLEFGYV